MQTDTASRSPLRNALETKGDNLQILGDNQWLSPTCVNRRFPPNKADACSQRLRTFTGARGQCVSQSHLFNVDWSALFGHAGGDDAGG